MEGYFKVHRKIIESQVFAHPTALKIWIWCLAKASYKERFVSLKVGKGFISVHILPGQFVFGRFSAEESLGIDGSTIYKWIHKFASDEFGMITIDSNNQYSTISICNWDIYQMNEEEKEQPCNSQVTTEEQPCNTNKKVQEGEERKEHKNNTWRTNFNIYTDELNNAVKVILDDAKWIAEQEALNPNVDIVATIKKGVAVYWGVEAEGYANKKKSRGNDLNWKSTFAKNMNKNIVWKSRGYNKPVSDIPFNENSFVKNSGLSQKSTEFKEF